MNHPDPPIGRIITFYSYKGGVGRSFALADVAVLLAAAGHRVLCVDWDLEAPGLSRYFQRWVPEGPHDGLLEAILAFETVPGATAAERYLVVEHPKTEGRLHLLPSGRMDADYVQAVQKLSWDDLYAKGFGAWLEDLRDAWQWRYDFILIDARTGLSDTGGICTVELPHVLVLFTTPNAQSVEGTKQVIDAALAAHAALDRDRPALRVLPVATRIDDSEFERTEKWMSRMSEAFSPYLSAWSTENAVDADRAFRSLAVPYVPYWSYGEELPVDRDHAGDPRSVLAAHQRLARELDPDAIPSAADLPTTPAEQLRSAPVFLSATIDQFDAVGDAVLLLRARGVNVSWTEDTPIGAKRSAWLAEKIRECEVHFIIVGSGPLPHGTKTAHDIAVGDQENSSRSNDGDVWFDVHDDRWIGLTVPLWISGDDPAESTEWLNDYEGVTVLRDDREPSRIVCEFVESTLKKLQKHH